MKKFIILFFLFIILCINVFAQKQYPFQVQVSGKGKKSIILIPGFASSGKVWNETKARFEKNYTCHVLTMAGFAGVPAGGDEATFKKWEEGIAAYISDKKLDKPVVIGHSMGGGLALALAANHPEIIGRIVVVDALPCLAAVMDPTFKAKEVNDCSQIVAMMTGMDNDKFYQMQKGNIPRLLADTTMQNEVISWSVKSNRMTFAKMYCDFSNTDLRESLSSIKCPSMILLEPSFAGIKGSIEAQYKGLNNADIRYATKGLHFIMYDDKDWYFQQLNSFISQ
jgi:pimeloyl-ACP methyl ester carboxylesterase